MLKLFKGILFIVISLIFYFFTISFAIYTPACGPTNASIAQNVGAVIAILLFFWVAIIFPSEFSKKGKIITTILIFLFALSVINSGLNNARMKGCDAVIKSNSANSLNAASLYYSKNNSYLGVCTSEGGVYPYVKASAKILSNKNSPTSGPFVYSNAGAENSSVCHDSDTAWAAITSLKKNLEKQGWCVDSTGASKSAISLEANITTCP